MFKWLSYALPPCLLELQPKLLANQLIRSRQSCRITVAHLAATSTLLVVTNHEVTALSDLFNDAGPPEFDTSYADTTDCRAGEALNGDSNVIQSWDEYLD